MNGTVLILAVLLLAASSASAFVAAGAGALVRARPQQLQQPQQLRMGFGDAFKKAFANEDFKTKDNTGSGLAKQPKKVDVIINGKKIEAFPGQKLKDLCASARVKVKYSCTKGDCGTCENIVDGRMTRICTAVVPINKSTCNVQIK